MPDEDDRYFDAQMRLAIALDQSERTKEALDTLHSLATLANGDSDQQRDVWLLEADILGKRGRKDDTFKVYAQALAAQPDDERLLYESYDLRHDEDAYIGFVRRSIEMLGSVIEADASRIAEDNPPDDAEDDAGHIDKSRGARSV